MGCRCVAAPRRARERREEQTSSPLLSPLTNVGEVREAFVSGQVSWEVGGLSARAVAEPARKELQHRHEKLLKAQHGLNRISSSVRVQELSATTTLVPVYIGAFELRGGSWRLLVNGTTGEVVADKINSRIKGAILGTVLLSLIGSPLLGLCLLLPFLLLYFMGKVHD